MNAIWIEENGGPEVLQLVERPDPEPAAGQLLVELAAAGVNYRDVYERNGGYGGEPPRIVGVEGTGRVRALGEGVTDFSPGDRVVWSNAPGSYAELVLVDAARAVPTPDGVDDETAAAALLQGMTAHYLSTSVFPIGAGDTAVVHAAAGGVGLLLTQLVKLRGGRVIGTTSTDEKAELVRRAGADEVIPYENFAERVRELTGGEGAAVVYDGIGRTTFEQGLDALRLRGMMVLYGQASGSVPTLELNRLAAKGLFLTRPGGVHYVGTREQLLSRSRDVFGWIASGELEVRIGGRYPLSEARRAHEDLEGRRTSGKLLLLPG